MDYAGYGRFYDLEDQDHGLIFRFCSKGYFNELDLHLCDLSSSLNRNNILSLKKVKIVEFRKREIIKKYNLYCIKQR